MKKLTSVSLAIILFGTLFLASCKKSDNAGPSNTGGTGTSSNYTGNWNNMENSSLYGSNTYPVTIEATNASTISFAFLYGFRTKVSATFNNNSFVIPMQTVENVNISGSGTLANLGQINMMYIVDSGINTDTVTAVLTK